MTGRVRSLSSRPGLAPWWPRIAEVPLRGLKSAGAFVSGTREGFNDWGGRGYDDFVPGEVAKTAYSGDRTT